jgi:hypothetical protein
LAHDFQIIAVQAKKLVHKPLISRPLALTVPRVQAGSQLLVFTDNLSVLSVFGNPVSGKFSPLEGIIQGIPKVSGLSPLPCFSQPFENTIVIEKRLRSRTPGTGNYLGIPFSPDVRT